MQNNAWCAAPHSGGLEQRIKRRAIAIYQIAKELRAGHETKRLRRRCISLNDPQIAHPHQSDRLRRRVEQRAVSGLDLAKLPVILLTLLLHEGQPGFKIGNGLNTFADCDKPGSSAKLDRCIL